MSFSTPRRLRSALLAGCCLLAAGGARAQIGVEFIAPSQWGRPDAELGLAGGVVEDFEDTALAPGLLIEIADATGAFTAGATATLPGVFDPVAGDPYGSSFTAGVWDGSRVLVNTETNAAIDYGSQDWRPIALTVPGGADWIALACQQVTVSHVLTVNGQAVGRLGALGLELGPGRNGVMVVRSGDPTVPIVSIAFGGRGDAFVIDHVVFAPAGSVPVGTATWSGLKAWFRGE